MSLILANKCTWWNVYSDLVNLMVYQISKACLSCMYMKHKHRIYAELCINHYLLLDQNESYNAYSYLLRHEVWNVEHKMVMMEIELFYNKFSHIGVQHHDYPEHDTVCMSIFFPWIIFCICPDQWNHFWDALLSDVVEIP